MGAIAECLKYGVARELLIPVLPFDQSFSGKGAGKAPAKFENNAWQGLDDWQRGSLDPNTVLRDADAAGGNCGLILGSPVKGHQLVAWDIDLDAHPKTVQWRNAFIAETQRRLGQPLLLRETLPYRALLLFDLPLDANPGSKKSIIIHHKDPGVPDAKTEKIGKLEILTNGQQCVVAGTHAGTKQPMTWLRFDGTGDEATRHPAPMIKEGVPAFDSFDALFEFVVTLLRDLEGKGFTFQIIGASATGGTAERAVELAPPSFVDLVTLIDAMPNPASADYDVYIGVLMAIGGCRQGLIETRGPLNMEDEHRLTKAIVDWATRWQAPKGAVPATPEEAQAKWLDDMARPRDERYAGWRQLTIHAAAFGTPASVLVDISTRAAQGQFTVDASQPPPPIIPGQSVLTVEQLKARQGVKTDLVVLADFTIADDFKTQFTGEGIWVPGLKTWFIWNGRAGWQSDETTYCKVEQIVEDKLWVYSRIHGMPNPAIGVAGWSRTSFEKVLSVGQRDRVIRLLQAALAKPLTAINQGFLKLQTPRAMYDMATLEPLEERTRKIQHETRSTSIDPEMNAILPTPYFDRLLMGLADSNKETYEWLLHYLGYCLLGDPKDEVFVIIYGSGSNGKSKLVEVLLYIFGSYATSLNSDVVQATGKNLHPASLNRLRGKRLALISELAKNTPWNEQVLKQVTGRDEVEARDMNKNPTPFRAQAGLLIVANEKPAFSNVEPAIQRRFRLINAVTRRSESEIITDIAERAKAEAPSVLHKLMLYAQKVYRDGALPQAAPAMRAFANEMLTSTDLIYAWLQAECDYATPEVRECYEPVDDLRVRYERFAKKAQEGGNEFPADKINPTAFFDRLRREGISLEDTVNVDAQGRAPRHRVRKRVSGQEITVYVAKGIRLRLKMAEAV